MGERENCIFCGTFYNGMPDRLGHSVCQDCWQEIVNEVLGYEQAGIHEGV